MTDVYARESDVMIVSLPTPPEGTDPPTGRRASSGPRGRRVARLEMLVVLGLLVVLGGVTLFALNGVSGDSAVAACNASTREVGSAVAALEAENFGAVPTTSPAWRTALLPGSTYPGAPYLGAWPHSGYYQLDIAGTGFGRDTGDGVLPRNGDVLVTITAHGLSYDATILPGVGCATA